MSDLLSSQSITARGPNTDPPGTSSQPATPLRTSTEIGQESDWTPSPRSSGSALPPASSSWTFQQPQAPAQQPQQPQAQPQAQQPTQTKGMQGALTGIGSQFRGEKVRRALLAGLETHQRLRYYSQAGLGTAATDVLRESLGAPTSYQIARQRRGIVGLDPSPLVTTKRDQGW